MALTPEQLHLATLIDKQGNKVMRAANDDEALLVTMSDYKDAFKRLMATSTGDEMDQLCAHYEGFYRYAKLIEAIAEGIADGRIKAPG